VRRARLFHVAACAAALVAARPAQADPQASVGVTAGLGLEDLAGPRAVLPVFHLGVRGDLLLLRTGPRAMGVGPYVHVATEAFESADLGGGLSWLIPAFEDLPIVLSGGGFARTGQGRNWSAGLQGDLFAGSRSYNFHSAYGMAIGFFAQTLFIPDPPATLDLVLGVRIDGEVLALPILFVVNGFR
jgi:hypothetical protein